MDTKTDRVELSIDPSRLFAELAAKDAALERFTYTVSHDLKTPLVTIKGFLALLRRDADTGDRQLLEDDIQQIAQAVDRLQRLLDELLEYYRVGRRDNLPERIDLGALARRALGLISEQARVRGVEIEIAPDMPVVVADAGYLLDVLRHLLDNAVKFMGDEPSPRVEVGVREDGDETVCTVRDNGRGIDPRDHDKVFELFKRLETDTRGTGAGLALVRRIVEVYGGRVWVESQGRGHGATFCFTLPRPARVATPVAVPDPEDLDDPLPGMPGFWLRETPSPTAGLAARTPIVELFRARGVNITA